VMIQVVTGLAIGFVVAAILFTITNLTPRQALALLAAVGTILLTVGAAAAIGPARRSLRIQTTEALRIDT
jgi:ABC-type antimicrobial peptide transport system permease subunit